jgi:hypothetical protein
VTFTGAPMSLDARLLRLFRLPRLIELRWLGRQQRVSLVTTDIAVLEEAAVAPPVQGLDAYLVVNTLMDDVVARRKMPLDTLYSPLRGQCVADADIGRITTLPFDFDPIRQTGTAATLEQIALAAEMRDSMVSYLRAHGFPEPAGDVFSGNGRHTYYATNLPNTPEIKLALYGFYTDLARRLDRFGLVKLDKSVRSPAQIMRLPGTFNHKAQRRCEIISIAETSELVTLEHIRAVLTDLRKKQGYKKPLTARAGDWTPERLEALLDFHSIDYQALREVPQGLLWVLSPCPFNAEHVGTSPAVMITKSGWPKFCCKHDSCQGKGWRKFLSHLNLANGKVFSWTP